jgi:hypothetical protein
MRHAIASLKSGSEEKEARESEGVLEAAHELPKEVTR